MSQRKQKVSLVNVRWFKHYLPCCYAVARDMVERRVVRGTTDKPGSLHISYQITNLLPDVLIRN